MARTSAFSGEVRERAVLMLFEHRGEYASEWEGMRSIASTIGCTAEPLRRWVRQAEVDSGRRAGLTSEERAQMKELERENRELRRANEILENASADFAQAGVGPPGHRPRPKAQDDVRGPGDRSTGRPRAA